MHNSTAIQDTLFLFPPTDVWVVRNSEWQETEGYYPNRAFDHSTVTVRQVIIGFSNGFAISAVQGRRGHYASVSDNTWELAIGTLENSAEGWRMLDSDDFSKLPAYNSSSFVRGEIYADPDSDDGVYDSRFVDVIGHNTLEDIAAIISEVIEYPKVRS